MSRSTNIDTIVERFIAETLPEKGDVLLIVPPFTSTFLPSLGPHLLQAIGKESGFCVHILYANLLFARAVGIGDYEMICRIANRSLFGERIFSAAAYGLPTLGRNSERSRPAFERRLAKRELEYSWSSYEMAAETATPWSDAVAAAVAEHEFAAVGCTTMFEQTSASVALLSRIKKLRPETITVIGGSNCEDEMAEGIASLTDEIDHVFSQESEETFPVFLEQIRSASRPESRIVRGEPCFALDSIPTPSFRDYFVQHERLIPRSEETAKLWDKISIPYESSRGCWWGQKHQCTFCGHNGVGMKFREKSADRVLQQLKELAEEFPYELLQCETVKISMTDNIMPRTYFRTLVPRLCAEVPNANIFYEQKANLSLEQVMALKKSGIDMIQPGIESLSSSYLKRMDKGVTAPQNITLLRYVISADLTASWVLLTHFPSDELAELEQILELLPLLRHLPPPVGLLPMSIDRFSCYHRNPEAYGLQNLRPLEGYAEAFPPQAETDKLAYFFTADYDCASDRHPEVIDRIHDEVRAWSAAWEKEGAPPMLSVQTASEVYRGSAEPELVLIDTRGLPGTRFVRQLSRQEASRLLVRHRIDGSPEQRSAVEQKLAVELDGLFVPLATADPELLLDLEQEAADHRGRRPA